MSPSFNYTLGTPLEVLSPATAGYDRTDKFDLYKRLPSLEGCVLVSQDEPRVDIFQRVRDTPRSWLLTIYRSGDRLKLASLDFECDLDALYN